MNELTTVFRQPIVGDLIYGGDFYYAQITRVGENVVEFETIGPIADEDAIRGPKGDKGDTGIQGIQGEQGEQGIPGEVQLKDMPHINLFDGTYSEVLINPGGAVANYASAKTTNYIPILPNQVYTLSGTNLNRRRYNFYDESYNFISYHSAAEGAYTSFTLNTSPSNARYIRIYYSLGLENGIIQLKQGSITTSYTAPDQIPEYALQEQEEWVTPTLLNGATGTIQYMKDSLGFVHFKGEVTAPEGGGLSFMRMPGGYGVSLKSEFVIWETAINSATRVLIIGSDCYSGHTINETTADLSSVIYQGV